MVGAVTVAVGAVFAVLVRRKDFYSRRRDGYRPPTPAPAPPSARPRARSGGLRSSWPTSRPGSRHGGRRSPRDARRRCTAAPATSAWRNGPCPDPGPGRGARRGGLLRHLRVRPPRHDRGVGQARDRGGPRVHRDRGRGRRRRDELGARRRRGVRTVAALRGVSALPGGQAVAVRAPLGPGRRQHRRGLRRLRGHRRPIAAARCPTGCRPGWRRWPSPWPWRCTASPGRAWSPATRPWCSGPVPSGRSPSPRWWPWTWARSWWSSRASGAGGWPPSSGAAEVLDPSELETYPPWEPERQSPRAVDVVFECSGKKAAMECGFHQLRRGGHLVLVGAGIEAPRFDPNRMILNELTVTGSFVYDADGFERALELLGSGRLPVDVLIDPDDVSLEGLGDAMQGLVDGRIAGKVMVVPGPTTPGRSSGGRVMPHPYYPSGNPRFNHVALSVPSDLLDEIEPRRHLPVLGAGARLRRDADDDPRPQAPDPVVRALGPVHLPHRRGGSHALSPHGPLRVRGGSARRAGGRARPRRRVPASRTRVWTSSTSPSTTGGPSRSIRSTSGYVLPMLCELQYWEFERS